jgi:hypothetical protein
MPVNPTYLHRLPAILAEARSPKPIPFFRRCDIEALFGLKKRQAINLMHRVGAIRVSNEIALDQGDLVAWLERISGMPSTDQECRRQERVIGRIVELKAETAARAVKIVLPDSTPPAGFPPGISLQPGVLTVTFGNEGELLERLFLLARLLATKPELIGNYAFPAPPSPA